MFALRETVASGKRGVDVWYRFWTIIGPCCTDELEKRALFPTAEAARMSQAYTFSLAIFEVVDVGDNAVGDLDWNKPAERPIKERVRKRR